MSITKEEIIEAVSNMSVMEVSELVKMMEEKFEVSAAMAVVAGGSSDAGESKAEEKTEFDVILTGIGSNKIATIKAVRALSGLGLKEAKELVESVPAPLKTGVSKEDADDMKAKLEEAGASVEIK